MRGLRIFGKAIVCLSVFTVVVTVVVPQPYSGLFCQLFGAVIGFYFMEEYMDG